MSTRFIIYGLVDQRTDEVRYIGKSTKGLQRPAEHGTPCRLKTECSHKANWIRSLHAAGLMYGVRVLGSFVNGDKIADSERWAIAYARSVGWPLTNLTDGGDGNVGWCPTPATRAKIGIAQKGRKHTAEHRA